MSKALRLGQAQQVKIAPATPHVSNMGNSASSYQRLNSAGRPRTVDLFEVFDAVFYSTAGISLGRLLSL